MISRISRNSKRIVAILSQYRSPAQLAAGIAIGVVLGLVPKDNLIAIALVVMICCLRVNQLVACMVAIALSFASVWFNPITSAVGSTLLEQPMIGKGIGYLYQYPILPWSCLENMLVMGGIGLGVLMFLPSYAICFWLFSKANQKLESIALEQVANDAIEYRKTVAEQSKTRQEKPLPSLKVVAVDEPLTELAVSTGEREPVTSDLENSDALDARTSKVSPANSARGADRQRKQRTMPTIFTGEVLPDGNDTFLRETVIEVVRYRKPIPAARESNRSQIDPAAPQVIGNSMPTGNVSTMAPKDSFGQSGAPATKGLVGQTISYDLSHAVSQTGNRDESLKYLLWHINGSKESVRKSSEKSA